MNKKKILLPFFASQLILVNLAFFISIAFLPAQKHKLLFISSLAFILYTLFFGQYILPKTPQETNPIKLTNVQNQSNQIISFKSFQKLDKFEKELSGLDKISPNNTNILVDLALIKLYKNQINRHQTLWNKAKSTDPNNPLFNYPPL